MHSQPNRLAAEKSPYLLQHAHNPVDWYPWGEEAFEKAAEEDKPIFLSIGYATCHWCHVMERESFEEESIAALMNEAFVCIKVDREERPDVDQIYMTVCQMMTGSGGWPLTIVMTPEKQPFYAGTYIPPESRYGRVGMRQLVPRLAEAWKKRRADVLASAGKIMNALNQDVSAGEEGQLGAALLAAGTAELLQQVDPVHGGFGNAPKFPTPHRLNYLLRCGAPEAVAAVEKTLERMRLGGVYDHVGFGIHRYATDREWLVPHFEKMLYDQALVARAYLEAYEITQKPVYASVAREILEYVQRDMTTPEGGFYSAEDADSEGEEGLFYLWSAQELKSVVGRAAAESVNALWQVSVEGNYLDEASRERTGKNILHLRQWLTDEDRGELEAARAALFAERETRIHPLKDTKVLADWNGLMTAAFARAARVLQEDAYLQVARRANGFVQAQMQQENGRLWHRWREGEARVDGQLEDYVFQIQAQLELYDATLELSFLEQALRYQSILEAHFVDAKGGGYFMTADDAEALIVRPKSLYDGAIPSGNSVQWLNLLKLARLTGRPEFEQQAAEVSRAFGGLIERSPSGFAQALVALQFATGESVEIVVVGPRADAETQAFIQTILNSGQPGQVILLKDPAEAEAVAAVAPFTEGLEMVEGKPTVYMCRGFACEQPVNTLAALKVRL